MKKALAESINKKAMKYKKMKKFLPKDFAGEIKRQEKVTKRIEAAYFGSVEKNMDLLIMKSPIMNSGPTAHLSIKPSPNGAT